MGFMDTKKKKIQSKTEVSHVTENLYLHINLY
jgi:hypothetical protein